MKDSAVSQECTHISQPSLSFRWLQKTDEYGVITQKLQQAYQCLTCGDVVWVDVPTELED